jgi:SpoVK/Ycf46/Vps4 family AAA+-type ATPase
VLVRRLRDLAAQLKKSYCTLIIVSPLLNVPPGLQSEVAVVEFPPPTEAELGELLDELAARLQDEPVQIELEGGARELLARAALGLTADEALNAWHRALIERGSLGREDASFVAREKRRVVKRSGALEFLDVVPDWSDIGGLSGLKAWLHARREGFSARAREFGLPSPRGVLLLGVPGCGKSLVARASAASGACRCCASMWQRLRQIRGESEANLRRALRAAESASPCVLWVDELEKAFSARGDDGGTALRVLGAFLFWLQERTAPVFVVATANSIEPLPPELLRRGRFDELFFVDLPQEAERVQIWRIHLRRRGRDPEGFDVESLARDSEGYSGAEIESATISALYHAFEAGREVNTGDLRRALEATIPLSRALHEEIASLRDWAGTRARGAS